MNFQWQTIIVVVAVITAAAYLARAAWQSVARRKAAACGGCADCPSGTGHGEPNVIEITTRTPPAQNTHSASRNGV
jgi:hypothetical protein